MLKRKMMERLMDWRRERGQECLLVKGARQTGKTFIVEQFGKENYDSFIEINFEETPSLRDVFNGDLAVPEMIKRLSLVMPGVRFIPGRTLLFLDEVQACPRARASLKFWALDGRFDVIATGSLLGINYRDIPIAGCDAEARGRSLGLQARPGQRGRGGQEDHPAPVHGPFYMNEAPVAGGRACRICRQIALSSAISACA